MRGRKVGKHAQRIPQFSSTTDQYAAGALSQKGSCVLIPWCRVDIRTREMMQVLDANQCLDGALATDDLQEPQTKET
jgi:hypothetical protein